MSDNEYYEEGGDGDYDGGDGGEDNEDYGGDEGGYEEAENYEQEEADEEPEPEEEEAEEHEEVEEEVAEDEEGAEPVDVWEEEPEPEEQNDDNVPAEEEDGDWNAAAEMSEGFSNNADSGQSSAATEVKGIFDGFGGGSFGDIIGNISSIAGESGGLSNIFSSGGLEKIIGESCHRFLGLDPSTGSIIGAIAGNIIFNMGGQGNSLGNIGKIILDNIISGKYKRDVTPFVSPVAFGGKRSFGLDFQTERNECLAEHRLFEDPEFPANDSSLFFKKRPEEHVEWLRPAQIVQDPQLIVGEKSRFDVKQGALGDCWLLAAVANLTLRDELFYRVVPPDQSFTENYAGIFHFQFWRYGQWIDVVIDDKLPCVDGKLYYMHSNDNNEFWSALIEKAYAKLYGSYENLEGGTTAEALEDFTGGLTEFFDLRKTDKSTILAMMIRGFQMGSLFGSSIDADPNQKEAPLDNGLVRGHAYSITALQTVNSQQGQLALVRIRNPWGNSKEWNGAWSDGSSEWYSISEEEKQKIGVKFEKDGEFWMSFDDFYTHFQEMEICNLSAAVMNEISEMTGVNVNDGSVKQWEEKAEDGEWNSQQGTAGGCINNADSYAHNPQFGSFFTVTGESVEQDGKCTVIVAVLQKYRREMRTVGGDSLPIGFSVYQVDKNHYGPLPSDFFHGRKAVARTKVYINMREVTCRFRVEPGQYIIVPSTFDPNCDGDFLLRMYANGALQTTRFR